jgi:hypothetical protein
MVKKRANRTNRRRRGGARVDYNPATMDYKLEPMSLKQGVQAQEMVKQYSSSGGAMVSLGGAPYGEALAGKDGLPADMLPAARMDKLSNAFGEIAGMKDQAGGRRRRRRVSRKGRKASRKGRKMSRKGRKMSRKGRKMSRKGRKSRMVYRKSRKNRMVYRKSRKNQRGGAASFADAAAEFSKSGDMTLGINPKAAGLNQEWHDVAATKGGDYMGPQTLETYRSDMP